MSEESIKSAEREIEHPEASDLHAADDVAGPDGEAVDSESGQINMESTDLDSLIGLRARLESAEAQLESQKEEALRAQAEVQNARRRAEKDIESAHKFALERFVNELLPIIDSLERGLEAVPADDEAQKASREGLSLTLKMFLDALAKFNAVQIDPQGEAFDPRLHQAMSIQENDELEPNTVVAVLQKGFSLNERLVRPAMVMVTKAPASPVSSGGVDEKV